MSTKKLRVLIADDELMARKRLRRLLTAMADVELVAECCDGEEALEQLDASRVDVALLDIQMPGLSGLDVSKLAADRGVPIVFATAHEEHALAAFETGAVDYVLKPIDVARLTLALGRVRERRNTAQLSAEPDEPTTAPARLALTVRGHVRLVKPTDISHAELDGELVSVWIAGEELITELSLTDLERRLPDGLFERVHRRALLNLDRVERLEPVASGGYLAVTDSGQEVPVSRQAARILRRRLGIR